jgi:hypothetical protein
MGEPPLTTFTTGLGDDDELIMPGPVGAAVASLRAVQHDPTLTPAYGAQVAVEGLELATLHIIRNESAAVVSGFAAKLPELIRIVRP